MICLSQTNPDQPSWLRSTSQRGRRTWATVLIVATMVAFFSRQLAAQTNLVEQEAARQDPVVGKLLRQILSQFDQVAAGDTNLQLQAQTSLTEARALGSPVAESKSLVVLGLLCQRKGDVPAARVYLLEAADLRQRTNDQPGLASVYNNLGVLEHQYGNFAEAIRYAQQALTIRQKLGDEPGLAASFTNIGNIYESQGLLDRAIDSHVQANELYRKTNNLGGQAGTLSNLANLYKLKGENPKALKAYQAALKLYTQLQNPVGRALVLTNLAGLLANGPQWQAALDYALEALSIRRQDTDIESHVFSLLTVAELFLQHNNTQVASVYLAEAYQKSIELGNASLQVRCLKLMANMHARLGNWDKAFLLQLRYSRQKDSLDAATNMTQLAKLENQYLVELKQNQILKLNADRRKAQADLLSKENTLLQTQLYLVAGGVGLFLSLLLALFYFRSNRKQQGLNLALQHQSDLLSQQNTVVQEKNKAIMDSISYAHQLQQSLQPDIGSFVQHGLELRVHNQPRDVVSGDFYWALSDDDGAVFVIADCIGHGVRGAMLTMYGQVLLNELVPDTHNCQPHLLLQEVDTRLCNQFHEPDGMPTGQMEMAVFVFKAKTKQLLFASARLPVFAVSPHGVDTIKSGQFALGNAMVRFKDFQVIELPLDPTITYYVCSDGLADQFGGPEDKKFTRKRLREMLASAEVQFGPAAPDQKIAYCVQTLATWQGNTSQTDDIILSAMAWRPSK